MSAAGYLPQVRDRDGSLRRELLSVQKEMGPDASLADVIRKLLREAIAARHNNQMEGNYHE